MDRYSWYSLQMEESLDITGTSQLIIIMTMIFEEGRNAMSFANERKNEKRRYLSSF